MPQGESLNRRKYEENEVILRFIIGESVIVVLFAIATLIIFINCQNAAPNPLIMIFATIFNLTRIFEFAYLFYVIVRYKRIGNKVKKMLRSLISRLLERRDHRDDLVIASKRLTEIQRIGFEDLGLR